MKLDIYCLENMYCMFDSLNFDKLSHVYTVKPVLSGHFKIDKLMVLMENGSLMQVKSFAECWEHSAILLTCI